jgi:hypothetical protein
MDDRRLEATKLLYLISLLAYWRSFLAYSSIVYERHVKRLGEKGLSRVGMFIRMNAPYS